MNKKQISSLKENLQKYSIEFIDEDNHDLQNAICTIVSDLEKQLNNISRKKSDDIGDIISLIEKNEIQKLNEEYPKIMYNDLMQIISSDEILENIQHYTTIQLKVIYFLLTKDKCNNAIKTKNKNVVSNAVKEAILERKRRDKLKNLYQTQD